MYDRYRELLDQVGRKYGVSPRVIAGVWGMESNFGKFSGVRPTIPALATLAYDPRRAAFFRGELLEALEILNRGDATLDQLRGSWAGAMGQTQFMPSAYLKFAEDFDGDGRRDIWSSPADVFASIANYLKAHGWTDGQLWGRQVAVSRAAARRIAADVRAARRRLPGDARHDGSRARWRTGRASACGCRAAARCRTRRSRRRSSAARRRTTSSTRTTTRCSTTTARTPTPSASASSPIGCLPRLPALATPLRRAPARR